MKKKLFSLTTPQQMDERTLRIYRITASISLLNLLFILVIILGEMIFDLIIIDNIIPFISMVIIISVVILILLRLKFVELGADQPIDRSDAKEKELALSQINEGLDQVLKMESIEIIAGDMAHDFNNILTGILGYLDLVLMEEKLTENSLHMISKIKSLIKDASSLTQDLLSFSKKRD